MRVVCVAYIFVFVFGVISLFVSRYIVIIENYSEILFLLFISGLIIFVFAQQIFICHQCRKPMLLYRGVFFFSYGSRLWPEKFCSHCGFDLVAGP